MKDNIIISADDFGMSEIANKRILDLVNAGKINRVSVFIDGELKLEEVDKLIKSGVKIDIHLDSFAKISSERMAPESSLKRLFLFLGHYLWGAYKTRDMEGNWDGEIKKFQSIFHRSPDGLNSHQYIHFFPPYFRVIMKLQKQYEIPYIRFGRKGILFGNNLVAIILRVLRRKNRKIFYRANCHSSDYLSSLDWLKELDKFNDKLPEGTLEFVTHPEREKEFNLVMKYF